MSLKSYDIALLEKIKRVFPNTLITSESNALLLSGRGDKNLEVNLPLITFDRINNQLAMREFGNDPMVRRGRMVKDETRVSSYPINITYQIDIWSDKRVEVDDIWRELVHFFYIDPEVSVKFDGIDEKEDFPLMLLDTDNTTDVTNFSESGRLYRQTISTEINQAKMMFVDDYKPIKHLDIRLVTLGPPDESEDIISLDLSEDPVKDKE